MQLLFIFIFLSASFSNIPISNSKVLKIAEKYQVSTYKVKQYTQTLNQTYKNLCILLKNSKLIAQDNENTYLGKILNSFSADSIFNEYGTYGSKYNSKSIWNNYSSFGSTFGTHSAFNNYTSTPPMIIKNKKIIGYLSKNKSIPSSVSPIFLKNCKEKL